MFLCLFLEQSQNIAFFRATHTHTLCPNNACFPSHDKLQTFSLKCCILGSLVCISCFSFYLPLGFLHFFILISSLASLSLSHSRSTLWCSHPSMVSLFENSEMFLLTRMENLLFIFKD